MSNLSMLPSEQGQYNGYTGYQVCTIGNLSVVHIHYLADNANANPSSSSTAIPFAIFIFCFDETRKALMRATSEERTVDKQFENRDGLRKTLLIK